MESENLQQEGSGSSSTLNAGNSQNAINQVGQPANPHFQHHHHQHTHQASHQEVAFRIPSLDEGKDLADMEQDAEGLVDHHPSPTSPSRPSCVNRLLEWLPPIIKPFELDQSIPGENVNLALYPVVGLFKDRQVADEYLRFAHRDAVAAFHALVALSGTLLYPVFGLVKDRQYCFTLLYVLHAVFWLLFPVELGLHAFASNTVLVATIRKYFQLMIAIVSTMVTGFCIMGLYMHCADSVFPLEEWGLKDPHLTPDRIRIYCQDYECLYNR
jgi:hypothetical protein